MIPSPVVAIGSFLAALIALEPCAWSRAQMQVPGPSPQGRTPQRRRPNVLIVMLDDVPTYFYDLFHATAPYELDTFTPHNKATDPTFGSNLYVQAPNLQRLADRGVTFYNAYANAACTPSRASILTGMFPHGHGLGGVPLTDVNPLPAHVILEFGDAPYDVQTLAELVRPKGYRSGHFGKWHLAGWNGSEVDFPGSGWQHIPDAGHWDVYKSSFHNPPVPPLPFNDPTQRHQGSHYRWLKNSNGVVEEIAGESDLCADFEAEFYTAEVQFNDTKQFVTNARQPWLAALWPNTDHALFQDPPDEGVATDEYHLVDEVQSFDLQGATSGTFTIRFMGETTAPIAYNASNAALEAALEALPNVVAGDVAVTGAGLPGSVTITFLGNYADTDVRTLLLTNLSLDAPNRLPVQTLVPGDCGPTEWHAFQAALEYMDFKLGEILDALEQSGRMRNTMIVFTSDNGGPRLIFRMAGEAKALDPGLELGPTADALLESSAGNRFKRSIYEGGSRVPLVISGAGVPHSMRGTTSNALIHLVDIYPTIAAMIGEPAGAVHGVDQGPVLRGQATEVRDEMLVHSFAPNGDHTMITGDRAKKNLDDIGYSKRLPSCGSAPAGRYKIIRKYNADGSGFDVELYRLEDGTGAPVDPFELEVLDDSMYDCQQAALEAALATLLAS